MHFSGLSFFLFFFLGRFTVWLRIKSLVSEWISLLLWRKYILPLVLQRKLSLITCLTSKVSVISGCIVNEKMPEPNIVLTECLIWQQGAFATISWCVFKASKQSCRPVFKKAPFWSLTSVTLFQTTVRLSATSPAKMDSTSHVDSISHCRVAHLGKKILNIYYLAK